MVVVAIVAFDFAAYRADMSSKDIRGFFLFVGALPMANVLAVGLLFGYRSFKSRRFFFGFEAFGAMALAIYITLVICAPRGVLFRSMEFIPLSLRMGTFMGQSNPYLRLPIAFFVIAFVFSWPQLAFALIGGLLCRLKTTPR
jgi:hypothetical protein